MLIDMPAAGTPERAELTRAIAASMWAGRESDWTFDDAGEYWQATFMTLAANALRGLEISAESPAAAEYTPIAPFVDVCSERTFAAR